MARPKAAVDYDGEIKLCDEMIAKYQAKKQRLKQAKLQDENERIVMLVRGSKLSLDELNSAVDEYMINKGNRDKANAVSEQPAAENITGEQPVVKEEENDEENH